MKTKTSQRILVAYDFSSRCRQAWSYARQVARRCGGTMEAVHVRSWFAPDGRPLPGTLSAGERRRLLAALARQIPGAARAGYHVAEGSTVDVILKLVRRRRIGLVVLAAEGASAARRLACGSTAEALMGKCPVPVVTLFERCDAARSILVPILDDCTAAGLESVAEAARALGARMTLMHVAADRLSGAAALRRLETLLAGLSDDLRRAVHPSVRVVFGEAPRLIAAESSRHGLVALLAGRASRAEAALGGMANRIVRLSRAPVIAIPELSPS